MSKTWKPNRPTVELRPSKIRREPPPPPSAKMTLVPDLVEAETRTVVIGILLFGLAFAFLIIWISDFTS